MSATLAMLRASLLSLTRDRQTLTETILFPAILVTAFGAFNLDITQTGFDATGTVTASTPYLDFVLPGLLALTSVQFAVYWTSVAYARLGETKVLRRLRATPMPFRSFLAAQVAARLLVIAVQATVVTLLALALGADIAGNPALVVAVTTFGAVAFLSIGFAVGSLAANAESANALSGLIVLPLVFLSGAFFPLAGLPSWLESVMAALPIVPLLAALRSVVTEGATLADIAIDLLRVLAWLPPAAGLAVLAMRSANGSPLNRLRTRRAADGEPVTAAPDAPDLADPNLDSIITLDDGRSLAYATYGDPNGQPVFYFHGHPGSRYEAALLHEAALETGVRIISTDRPGMGQSSFHRRRTILHWPNDVEQLAEQLGIRHFAVIGISGGGPYAAACAYHLPHRVTTCSLLSSASPDGLGPITNNDDHTDDEGPEPESLAANRLQARLVRYAPWLLRPAFAALAHSIRRQSERAGHAAAARAALQALPPVDQAAMADPGRASRYGRSLTEAVRQGGRGPAWEARLLSRPWGFDPASIDGPQVHVWHGQLDRNVPVAAGRALAATIPGASANIHPNHGHLSVAIAHLPTILTTATTPETTQATISRTRSTTPHADPLPQRVAPLDGPRDRDVDHDALDNPETNQLAR